MVADAPSRPKAFFILIGALLGGAVGFLLRPSNMLTGQLDFATVITRGANLKGLDALLKSQAESSFNTMLLATIVGAGIGFLLAARKG